MNKLRNYIYEVVKMKKIIVFLFFMFLISYSTKVNAKELDYYNLIDLNQIEYNSETDTFYSEQEILLNKNETYTLVVSSKFFGLNQDLKSIGVLYDVTDGEIIDLDFKLTLCNSNLYYSTITLDKDCILIFEDFLCNGHTLQTIPKNEIILFKGDKEEFKGFRKAEYKDNYVRIMDEIEIYTNYDDPLTGEEISRMIVTYDNLFGFSNDAVLVDDRTEYPIKTGRYALTYKCIDDAGNVSTLIIYLNILDVTCPAILGPDVIEINCYEEEIDEEFIKSYFVATDNVDGQLTDKITLINPNVLNELSVVGEHKVELSVKDSSMNETTKEVVVRSVDKTPPNLELKDKTIYLSELGESIFGDFYEQVILKISDNSGTFSTFINVKELNNKMGFYGTYEITVRAVDESGNETVETATLRIVDDIAPEFYLHTDLLKLTSKDVFSFNDLKETIANSLHSSGILYDTISLISCDYFTNEKTPGKYTVKYLYTYRGEVNYMIGTIKVEEAKADVDYWLIILVAIPLLCLVSRINKKRKKLKNIS